MNTRLLATLLLLFAAISLTAAETRKPNVLVFLSDDVRKNGR